MSGIILCRFRSDLFISDSKILNPGHMNFICKFTYEFIRKFYIWIFTYEFIGKLCSIIGSIWTHAAPIGAAGKICMSYVLRKLFLFIFCWISRQIGHHPWWISGFPRICTSNCELTEEILAILEFICNLPMKFICKLRSKIHM